MVGDRQAIHSESAFRLMQAGFAKASAAHPHGRCEGHYTLAGQAVNIRIVGRELAACMHQPFAHVRMDHMAPKAPRLTIELWDQRETGVDCQSRTPRDDLNLHPMQVQSVDGRFVVYQLHASIICLDRQNGHMIGCISRVDELSLYELGRPLHVPLTWWHNDRDVPVIHAGLVARDGKGVLFVGSGGAGKSTSALACFCAGFRYISDDLIGLQTSSDGAFSGHSLYNSTYVEAGHLSRFPLLRPHVIKKRYAFEKKCLVLLSQVLPLQLDQSTKINVVMLPRVVHEAPSQIRPAPKGKALLALAPSSRAINQSIGVQGMNKLIQLVERVPCYWLELGRDWDHMPARIENLLSAVA